jgi:hypothetical protein
VSGVDGLVRWLGEQLDEDERIARAATLGPWVQSGIGDHGWTVDFGRPGAGVETADTEQGLADADFIAAHNPARVLREIDAKRRVLAEYEQASRYATTTWGQSNADQSRARTLGKMVRLLASVYSDRPGHRSEWAP